MKASPKSPLEKLSDDELLEHLEILSIKEKQTTLDILLHLIEVDKRSLYLPRGYNSLFDYCVRCLSYSESAANRRIQSARCIRDFPEVYEMLAKNELNLCTVSRIAGILSEDNKSKLLAEVRHHSIRQVEAIVSRYSPMKCFRDRVRPLYIRRKVTVMEMSEENPSVPPAGGKSTKNRISPEGYATGEAMFPQKCTISSTSAGGNKVDTFEKNLSGKTHLEILEKKFKLECMVDPHVMEKLSKIKNLLSTKYPSGIELGKLLDILADAYLDRHSPESIKKRREKRRERKKSQDQMNPSTSIKTRNLRMINSKESTQATNQLSRQIPQNVRDEVFSRDGGKCTYVSSKGVKCNSTWNIQIDHIVPYARGGDHSAANLRLLCQRHNQLEAKRIYGSEFIKSQIHKRSSTKGEVLRR